MGLQLSSAEMTEVVYYRKLPLGVKKIETGESMFVLGIFHERDGHLRRFDGQGRVDVNAELVAIEVLPDAPDDFKAWFQEEKADFESNSWETMYGTISIGKVVFTPGMYIKKEAAIKAK